MEILQTVLALLVEYIQPVVGPLALFVFAWMVSNWIQRLVAGSLRRAKIDETLTLFLSKFTRWMVRDGRAAECPVQHLQMYNVRTDIRCDRRALTDDELRALLGAAASGPVNYGMSGPDRAMLYRLAVETGFRAAEIASLTPRSCDLSDEPVITVAAAYSKRRREDVQPIRRELADALAAFCTDRDPSEPIFKLPYLANVARMLRRDLEAAGIAYKDATGRVADFHALRHTFVTNLARNGVAPKMTMDLARHSDIKLTMTRYSHTVLADRASALDALPSLDAPETQSQQATGTDGRNCAQFVQNSVREGSKRSAAVRSSATQCHTTPSCSDSGSSDNSGTKPIAPGRTRTCDPWFRKPVLRFRKYRNRKDLRHAQRLTYRFACRFTRRIAGAGDYC